MFVFLLLPFLLLFFLLVWKGRVTADYRYYLTTIYLSIYLSIDGSTALCWTLAAFSVS
jgi:hypothetical protein